MRGWTFWKGERDRIGCYKLRGTDQVMRRYEAQWRTGYVDMRYDAGIRKREPPSNGDCWIRIGICYGTVPK